MDHRVGRWFLPALLVLLAAPAFGATGNPELRLDSGGRAGTPGSIAIGVGLGEPTSIEFGYWFAERQWLSVGLGGRYVHGSIVGHGSFHLGVADLDVRSDRLTVPFHVGLGVIGGLATPARIRWPDNAVLAFVGVRVPIGIDIWFQEIPLSLFFEIAPQVTTLVFHGVPDVFGGQIGVRFHIE